MKYFIFLVFTEVLCSQSNAYEKFQNYVQSSNGCVLWIEYSQSYFGDEIVSSGVLYVKEKMYIYDNEKQFIKYEDGLITTINKSMKQVVYDFANENDVTIFDILTGNNQSVQIDGPIIENNLIRIPFSIELWAIKGSIWANRLNGSPEKVSLIQDEDTKLDIFIKSSENKAEFAPPDYDIAGYEVINLVE
tara:strand:- start:343 stop:912 length:570 start_codon:yes stop_codon:yes gene_type:complete